MSTGYKFLIAAITFVFLASIAAMTITERVKEGHVAVVYTPSGGAKKVLEPGWHMKGLFHKTYEFSVRQEVQKTSITVNTSDGKIVTIPVTYNVRIDESKALELFKKYGARGETYYYDTVIQQQLQKISKETITKYSTIDIFTTKMSEAGNAIGEALSEGLKEKGFIITDLALLSPELDADTQAAIDAQVQAQQNNSLKKLELENDKIDQERAENQKIADQKQRQIDADTKAYETKAAADAEAYANKVLADSITQPLLTKMEMEARLKHGWITISGSSVIVDDTAN